jgi:hypothetical protein
VRSTNKISIRFYKVLPERLEKFNLVVAKDKPSIMRFSRFQSGLKNRFCFLSFKYYWDSDTKGKPCLFRRTGRKKLQTTKPVLTGHIKENWHIKTSLLLVSLDRKLRGHYNYFGAIGNLAGLHAVLGQVMEQLHKWLNRRSYRDCIRSHRI